MFSFCSIFLYQTITTFKDLYRKALENIVGKGENTGNQHFLLFQLCFQLFTKQISIFQSHLFCLTSANVFNSDQSKILLLGKELNVSCYILFCSMKTSRYRHNYVNTILFNYHLHALHFTISGLLL